MFFKTAILLAFVAASIAAPVQKRAVLAEEDYADFQVSDGVAGNAQAEVESHFNFAAFQADLKGVSAGDLAIIQSAREIAEDAETGKGGFNDAIKAAGSSSAKGVALQIGKIKNKVLKLDLEVLALQIQQAQGKDTAAKIAEETKKLNTNIDLDKKAAGQASQSIDFEGAD